MSLREASYAVAASLLIGGLAGFSFGNRDSKNSEILGDARRALDEAQPIVLAAALNHPHSSTLLPNLSQAVSTETSDLEKAVAEHAGLFFQASEAVKQKTERK